MTTPPTSTAPRALIRHEAKIHKCVGVPTRNRDAAIKIDPGFFRQEFLKIAVVHFGNMVVQKNRTRTLETFKPPTPPFDQNGYSRNSTIADGENVSVFFDWAF